MSATVFSRVCRLLLVLLAGTISDCTFSDRLASASVPNIVLIMADDAGAECFGSYGGESYATPHVDRLAREGIRFMHCYSQPICTPSRVKLMTGLSNIRNYSAFSILEPDQKTFGHMLQAAGYRTCVVGKWQLYGSEGYGDWTGKGTLPNDAGFDEYCLWQIDKRRKRYWNPLLVQNGEYLQFDESEETYGPDVFWQYAEEFLERNREKPFFLYYPMCLPHDPFLPTPDTDAPPDARRKSSKEFFDDHIAYTDKCVGRIANKIDELGLGEDTLILFTCDNGTHRSITSRANGRKVQGGKGLPTHAGMHVPLVARWSGSIEPGSTCDDLVDFSDFLPTIAEATGARPLVKPDGRSFLPQLRGQSGNARDWIYCYYYPRPGNNRMPERRFAFDKRWKLDSNGLLFDLQNDLLESAPVDNDELSSEAAAAQTRLQAAIDAFPTQPAKIASARR